MAGVFHKIGQVCTLAGLALVVNFAQAATPLLVAENLTVIAKKAKGQKKPIALLLGYSAVKSTENLKNEALLPYLQGGELDSLAIFAEINMDGQASLIDFNGDQVKPEEFAQFHNFTSFPVMAFFNAEGEPVADRLISGAYDYYGYYLIERLKSISKSR
jgi:hypothetical protein